MDDEIKLTEHILLDQLLQERQVPLGCGIDSALQVSIRSWAREKLNGSPCGLRYGIDKRLHAMAETDRKTYLFVQIKSEEEAGGAQKSCPSKRLLEA
jgi:hypothetical protein